MRRIPIITALLAIGASAAVGVTAFAYPNPSGIYMGTNPLVSLFNGG